MFWSNLPATVATVVLSGRLGATLVGVALLVALGALHTRPVGRLGTVAASVAELVAVTALDLSHVLRLRALLRHVALLVAVAAGHDALLVTLLSAVAFLTAEGVPLVVELGVSLDVLLVVLILRVLTSRMQAKFGGTDLDELTELRD